MILLTQKIIDKTKNLAALIIFVNKIVMHNKIIEKTLKTGISNWTYRWKMSVRDTWIILYIYMQMEVRVYDLGIWELSIQTRLR
jgi:hypothetical protein